MSPSGPSGPRSAGKPLIFISCGQYTEEEKALGKELERIVRESTPYDAYFAEVQNSLEGLTAHILSSLERCVGFVAVAHQRGKVRRPHDEIVRASVWVEQEIAIAAFIQHVLNRKIEVALYLQRGIQREGIREQLRLAPVEFDSTADVINDFRRRVADWKLEVAPRQSLVAKWRFEAERRTRERHDYRLFVDLVNDGTTTVTDWRIRAELPRVFAPVGQGDSDPVTIQEDSSNLPVDEAKLYPGDTKANALLMAYYVDQRGYAMLCPDKPAVKLTVWSGDALTWSKAIPISERNDF
jgi:hypothetical protein